MNLPKMRLKFRKEKNGLTTHYHEEDGHSWVRNAWNMLFQSCTVNFLPADAGSYGAGYMNMKNISGAVINWNYGDRRAFTVAPDTNTGRGIVIGSGNTAFSVEDHKLDTQITAMDHQNHFGYATAYNSGTKTWTSSVTRPFVNNTGSAITVRETGVVAYIVATYNNSFLMARDVLASPLTIEPTETLFVTYEFSQDFSALENLTYSAQWNRNAWNAIFVSFTGAIMSGTWGEGYITQRWNTGSVSGTWNSIQISDSPGSAKDSGLMIGTSDASIANTDYTLSSRNTTFSYGAQVANTSYNSGAKEWQQEIYRTFINVTGSPVTIKEVGLGTGYHTVRHILPTPVTVAPLEILKVTYLIKKDFSDID